MKKFMIVAFLFVCLSNLASAQTFSYLGGGDTGCLEKTEVLKQALGSYTRTVDLKQYFIVAVCTEKDWSNLMNQPFVRMAAMKTNTAFTLLKGKRMYVRMDGRSYEEIRATVAHELGHVLCDCQQEDRADAWRDKLLKK